jgi:hypothetical protein
MLYGPCDLLSPASIPFPYCASDISFLYRRQVWFYAAAPHGSGIVTWFSLPDHFSRKRYGYAFFLGTVFLTCRVVFKNELLLRVSRVSLLRRCRVRALDGSMARRFATACKSCLFPKAQGLASLETLMRGRYAWQICVADMRVSKGHGIPRHLLEWPADDLAAELSGVSIGTCPFMCRYMAEVDVCCEHSRKVCLWWERHGCQLNSSREVTGWTSSVPV